MWLMLYSVLLAFLQGEEIFLNRPDWGLGMIKKSTRGERKKEEDTFFHYCGDGNQNREM